MPPRLESGVESCSDVFLSRTPLEALIIQGSAAAQGRLVRIGDRERLSIQAQLLQTQLRDTFASTRIAPSRKVSLRFPVSEPVHASIPGNSRYLNCETPESRHRFTSGSDMFCDKSGDGRNLLPVDLFGCSTVPSAARDGALDAVRSAHRSRHCV